MYTSDFSTTGIWVITYTDSGAVAATYQLSQIDAYAPLDGDATIFPGRDDLHLVCIRIGDQVRSFDVRDFDSPTYATTQDLLDDINAAISAIS